MNAGFKFMRIAMNSLETLFILQITMKDTCIRPKVRVDLKVLVDIMIYFMPTAYCILV